MSDASEVLVAVTGGAFAAPVGTALPTTYDEALNVAFDELGYVSEEGITQSIDESVSDIRAWQNGDVVRKVQDSHDVTFSLSMLQTNEVTLDLFYGEYTAGVATIRGDVETRRSWVFNIVDGDRRLRLVVPDGQITDRGDVQYVNGQPIMYPITITAYPDDDGDKAIIYSDLEAS